MDGLLGIARRWDSGMANGFKCCLNESCSVKTTSSRVIVLRQQVVENTAVFSSIMGDTLV